MIFLVSCMLTLDVSAQVQGNRDESDVVIPILGPPETPVLTIQVTADPENPDAYFAALLAFAQTHAFEFRVLSPAFSDRRGNVSELLRHDIRILSTNPFEPEQYRIHFYWKGEDDGGGAIIETLAIEMREIITSSAGLRVVQ
jgi:hypothetical protein